MPEAFDTWLTNKQVGELLHVTRRTLYDWAADPSLNFPQPAFVKNRRYYSRAAIEAWRASRQLGAPPMPNTPAPSLGLIPPIEKPRRARRKAGSLIDPRAETVEG